MVCLGRFALALLALVMIGVLAAEPVSYSPEDCLEVTVEACRGSLYEERVTGAYTVYNGDCGNTGGRQAYYKEASEQFLFHSNSGFRWIIGPTCGVVAITAGGNAVGDYPFLNPAPTWTCAPDGENKPVSIECTLYEGQLVPCNSGTYNITGNAPSGECTNTCPPHLPYSKPGSTTFDDCLTVGANMFVVSTGLNRIVVLNADTDDYQLLKEGGEVDTPADGEFINETELFVAMNTKSRVEKFNIEGHFMGTFAFVISPLGILHFPEFDMVAIAASAKRVFFFGVNDHQGEPLQENDAVGVLRMSDVNAVDPMYLSRGENLDEILITTDDGKVVRMCVPTTACTTASRVMLKNDGVAIVGIATLHSKGTFLVADSRGGLDDKIYECSLTWVYNTHVADCDVFASMPEGTYWDPFYVEVDAVKGLVYVTDLVFNAILVFSFTGDYIGRPTNSMGALISPAAMALRPGPLPSLSSVAPTSSLTAGTPYHTALSLRDSANSPLPPTYPLEAELNRYRITATGFFPGTEIASVIEGTISLSNSSNTLTASLTIPYAGNFTVAVTEGLTNPQTLHNGAFQVTVNPAPTDPASCEAEFEQVLTAGSSFCLDITTMDAYRNPTTGASFSYSCCVDEIMTKAGEYTVDVTPAIKGNPFRFDVKPDVPHVATSTHNIVSTELVSEKETLQELRVLPKDQVRRMAQRPAKECEDRLG